MEAVMKTIETSCTELAGVMIVTESYLCAGRANDAVAYLSRTAERFSQRGLGLKAIAVLKKASAIAPENTEVLKGLAKLFLRCRMKEDAIRHCIKAAFVYYRAGRAEKAIQTCRKIVALDPSSASARLALAEMAARTGLKREAREAFLAAASLFERSGDAKRAAKAYSMAEAIRPECPKAIAMPASHSMSLSGSGSGKKKLDARPIAYTPKATTAAA
jgi:tetratricopeptide (TPR) repeat protein